MLYFTREEFPTYRVDVDVLFGRELIGRGNAIDFVMQAQSNSTPFGRVQWRGRTVFVGRTRTITGSFSRVHKLCLGLWHDLHSLRLITRDRYDAVQVRDKFLIASLALPVARLRGVKFFFWLSFPIPEDDLVRSRAKRGLAGACLYLRGHILSWLLYKWILPHCDHAFVQSKQMLEDVAANGIDRLKLTPVPMGISVTDIAAPGERFASISPAGDPVTVAYLGSLNVQRKVDVLIEMVAILKSKGIVVKLLLIGDGDAPEDRLIIERRAELLQVRHMVEITGFLPRADALARMKTAELCISPFLPTRTLRSASPTKLVEYLALGIPVVANDHPEQSLILEQSRAGVCVPWGAKYFARAVCWLIGAGRERRMAMGDRGRVWVQAHRSYDLIADDVERKYHELLGSSVMAGRP